ncbi:hypothetical protein CEXT_693501 [Caerostris extrusa]|uniref:Uncharacterized protein n=1 Tax=Caerostris extrusa TaxID=172846 RepID=A0AAV4N0L7_CAEEX|nr:hypothetical protein CEXT_693501 [Caerostris extrusa]
MEIAVYQRYYCAKRCWQELIYPHRFRPVHCLPVMFAVPAVRKVLGQELLRTRQLHPFSTSPPLFFWKAKRTGNSSRSHVYLTRSNELLANVC